jgi:hypothetical protein
MLYLIFESSLTGGSMTRYFFSAVAIGFFAANVFGGATARSGAGLAAATAARDQFRADIGGGTVAGANGSFGGVRREINWDGVPDVFAAPNNLPANFFNVNSPRGVVFSTPGTGFQVSATAASGTPVRFGNIDPSYSAEFTTFSPERLFTPLGSTVTDVDFFLPGTNIPATVSSFGVMFSDIDFNQTSIELFGVGGTPMGSLQPPSADHDVSFVGITFTSGERLAHVRITSGNLPLAPGNHDAAPVQPSPFVDDFIYSEPQISAAVPAMSMSTLALLAGVLLCIGVAVMRT